MICSTALDELQSIQGSGEKLARNNQAALKINEQADKLKKQFVLATIHPMGKYRSFIGELMRARKLHEIGIAPWHQRFWLTTAARWLTSKTRHFGAETDIPSLRPDFIGSRPGRCPRLYMIRF